MLKLMPKFKDEIKTILRRSRIISNSHSFFNSIKKRYSDKPQEILFTLRIDVIQDALTVIYGGYSQR